MPLFATDRTARLFWDQGKVGCIDDRTAYLNVIVNIEYSCLIADLLVDSLTTDAGAIILHDQKEAKQSDCSLS